MILSPQPGAAEISSAITRLLASQEVFSHTGINKPIPLVTLPLQLKAEWRFYSAGNQDIELWHTMYLMGLSETTSPS